MGGRSPTRLGAIAFPLALALGAGTAFGANEWTHGGVAEGVGVGHHHLADYGGYHCAPHDDATRAALHRAHMHGNATMTDEAGVTMMGDATRAHAACPGGAAEHGHAMAHGHGGTGRA